MKFFFTSDTHFGHGNIIKYCDRPFLAAADIEAKAANGGTWHTGEWKGRAASQWRITPEAIAMMDDTLINNINKTVGENDTLYHLGDFCMAGKHGIYEKCKYYRNRIKCRNIHFVWGNHDERVIRDLFSSNHDLFMATPNGQQIVLCHYALAVWDKSHRGSWQLYGHSHSAAEPWMNANMVGRRSMDVGVDNAYKILGEFRPFSFEEIRKIMDAKEGFSFDHHIPKNAAQAGPKEEDVIASQAGVPNGINAALEKCRSWQMTDEECAKLTNT